MREFICMSWEHTQAYCTFLLMTQSEKENEIRAKCHKLETYLPEVPIFVVIAISVCYVTLINVVQHLKGKIGDSPSRLDL